MRKMAVGLLVLALGIGLAGPARPALADGWHHHHRVHCGDVLLAAGVALTGLAVLDAVLSPRTVVYQQAPAYYAPPPVVYTPPPVTYCPPPVVYAPAPVCRPVYVVPRVTYYWPAYCPPPVWGPRPGPCR